MQNKSKINIAVVLLAIGIGLIPTGLIVNEYIRDQVGENLPSTISHINEQAILEIEGQYLGLGVTEVLPELQKQETEDIKDDIVEVRFIPSTLLYLKNLSMPLFKERLNASMTANTINDNLVAVSNDILSNINGPLSAQIINETLDQVININLTTSIFAREQFFNNYTFQLDFEVSINGTSIRGISEYITDETDKLNFTSTAQQRLLDGYLSNPGLILDIDNGTGILDFMDFYENATIDPNVTRTTMQNAYNSTWNQLTAVANYISDYLWDSVIPMTWKKTPTLPSTYANSKALELFFNNENWSTVTGNLSTILGVSEYQTGGLNNLSYTTTSQQRILSGYNSAPGILENIFLGQGVIDYLEYYVETSGNGTMQTQYNATYHQLSNLTSYIIQYIRGNIVPTQLTSEGLTLETASLRDFYIQWANASFFTNGIGINELSSEIGELLKARSAANEIRNEISSLPIINETIERDLFFNNYTFRINFSTSILGVSEYNSSTSYSLNYTFLAQERLLEGFEDAPGIFNSIESGFGLLNWLDFYQSALLNIGTNRTSMVTTYNATWDQLLAFGQYLRTYILGTVITAGAQKGLEAGIPIASNIEYDKTVSLWDPMNVNGIVNDSGINKWYKAATGNQTIENQLNATFNLTQSQLTILYDWLIINVKNRLTPIVFIVQQPLGIRLTTDEYASILFLEQWANGTVIPSGMDLGDGLKGFEIGLPLKSNISYSSALALFDTRNTSAMANNIGILKWIDSYEGDTAVKNELSILFGLNSNQVDMIGNWLITSVKQNIVPIVLTDLTEYTMLMLAEFEFHRQWANGTLFASGIDLDPAFGLSSITGWELGIPIKSDIYHKTSESLWDEEDIYSFVNFKGNGLWFMASRDKSAYDTLKVYFELDDTQMEAIIAWLERIREDYSLNHLKEILNLPTDVYTYGSNVNLGFTISGIIFLALGCIATILIFLTKRR
ncbi:MAG: hypothetical protein ACXAEX_18055 [Promethearchaeota archaeon]|jgi:hypothetical protein